MDINAITVALTKALTRYSEIQNTDRYKSLSASVREETISRELSGDIGNLHVVFLPLVMEDELVLVATQTATPSGRLPSRSRVGGGIRSPCSRSMVDLALCSYAFPDQCLDTGTYAFRLLASRTGFCRCPAAARASRQREQPPARLYSRPTSAVRGEARNASCRRSRCGPASPAPSRDAARLNRNPAPAPPHLHPPTPHPAVGPWKARPYPPGPD